MNQYRNNSVHESTLGETILLPPDIYEDAYEEKRSNSKFIYCFVKRGFDIILSLLGLIILSPLFLVVAILIKAEDGGPVFFRSNRVGVHEKPIGVFKFRSMRQGADSLEKMLTPEELAEYYKEFKLAHDPRITKIGSFLRKSSLDELPQLLNILLGDMSIVGPRPLAMDELKEKYSCEQRKRLTAVRPGLTGLWQVNGRSDCTYESGKRQRLELTYVEKRSMLLDLKIMVKTIGVVSKKVGAR